MNTTTFKTDAEIIAAVSKSVALHNDSKDNLVTRIKALMEPVPGAATIKAGGHEIAYRTVYATCSQWGNGAYPRTGSRKCYVIDGSYVLGQPDCSFFDGNNHQDQINSHRWSLSAGGEETMRTVPAGILRTFAKALPAALIQYAECCEVAAAENNTLATAA